MKRFLFMSALASVALASCVNDESNAIVDAPQPLRFDAPVMTTQTRANVKGEITSSYPTGEDFMVYSKKYVGNFKGWTNSENSVDFFKTVGEIAKHNGSYWATDTKHTWPLSTYNLAFAAFSPAKLNEGASVTYDAAGLTITNFTTETESEKQYDLMFSDRVVDRNNTNNGNTAVNIHFHHALSSIVFSVSKGTDNPKNYEIESLKIVGKFYTTGTFKQNIVETTSGSYSETSDPKWEISATRPDNETTYIPQFDKFTASTTPAIFTGGESALLLIPQQLYGDEKILITFTKTEDGLEDVKYTDYEIPLSEFKLADANPITNWVMGNRYNYRIYFGGTPLIFFNPTVDAWVDGGIATYTIR